MIWLVLAGVLATAETEGPTCPADEVVRRELCEEAVACQIACNVHEGRILMAAVRAGATADEAPRVGVLVIRGDVRVRADFDLDSTERDAIKAIPADEWRVSIDGARLGRTPVVRVSVIGRGGEDYFYSQEVVSFLVPVDGELRLLWTGLGDRVETRFDACTLDTAARFRMLPDGRLERTLRTSSTFQDPGGTDMDVLQSLQEGCIAPPPRRERFQLAQAVR